MRRISIALAVLVAIALCLAQHTVTLTWTQSTSPGITSNNVYRGTASGGPYSQIYPSSSPITSYNDVPASSGTYYYVVTAVSSAGESGYSNEVQATDPPPSTFATPPQNWVDNTINTPPGAFDYTVILASTPTNYGPNCHGFTPPACAGATYTNDVAGEQDALNNWRDNSDRQTGSSAAAHWADNSWLIEKPAQGSSGSVYYSATTYPSNNAAITWPGKLNPASTQLSTDGAMAPGSSVLTSASNPFTVNMKGAAISVSKAGNAGGSVPLVTWIASWQSAGQVTLGAPTLQTGGTSGATVTVSNVEPTKGLVIDSQDVVANPSHLPAGRMVCGWGLANFGGKRNPGCDGHTLSGAQNDKQYMWKMVLSNLPGFFAGIYAQEDLANPLSFSGGCRGWAICVPYANHILMKHGEITLAPGAAQSFSPGPTTAPYLFQAADGTHNGASGSGVFIPGIWSTNLGVVGMYMHGWDPGDPGQPTTSAATVTAISCTGAGPYTCTYTAANTFQPGQIVNITGTYTCPACVVLSGGLTRAKFEVSQANSVSCASSCATTATQTPVGASGSWTNTGTVTVAPDGGGINSTVTWVSGSYFGLTFTPGSTIYIGGTAYIIADTTLTHTVIGTSTPVQNSQFSIVGTVTIGTATAYAQSNPPAQYAVGSGDDTRNAMQFNSDGGWVQDNYIEKIHEWNSESHGIGGGFMNGPVKIVNNWIEGGSVPLFFGGAAVDTSGGPMYDAEIRRNHLGADLQWRQLTGPGGPFPPFGCGTTDGPGTTSHSVCPFKWGRKNSLELKIGSQVVITGNELMDDWVDGQSAYCLSVDARTISGGSMAGVFDGSNVPRTFTDNIRIESNWLANCGQNAFAGQSSSPGNGGGVSKKLAKIDVVNNLFSNLSDDLQNGKAGSEFEWTSGGITYPCAVSGNGTTATATCAPYQADLTANTSSIVAGAPNSCGAGCVVVTVITNIGRMDPILCTVAAATCIANGWTAIVNYPSWSGTFVMTATNGNWNTDGTGGGNGFTYNDTANNPSGTLCSSISDCGSKLTAFTFASLGYKITNIAVGDGLYVTDPGSSCTGFVTTSPTTPVKAISGTLPYGTGASMTVAWSSSTVGSANCLISNAPGPPNGVTFQNNTLLAINGYAITNFGRSWWPINNWFWNNVFADNPAGVASDIECNNPVGGGFGEGTKAFTCWDSTTLEVYKNAFMGHCASNWGGSGCAAGATAPQVDPLSQCSSGCINSFPALAGGYPSGSCTYDGSNPLNCPMMALPWSTNFSLSNVATMSGNPPPTQGVNITTLTTTATANIYTCPAGLSCGAHGPYPDGPAAPAVPPPTAPSFSLFARSAGETNGENERQSDRATK